MPATFILIDCEAPLGVGAPCVGDMTEFGAVVLWTRETFHGRDCSAETFAAFCDWIEGFPGPRVMVSDNPAFDFQWINFYFWKYLGSNPLGHSARRIGDFAAGMDREWRNRQKWKKLRRTPHDHNPVNDAMGNAEALEELIRRCEIKP